jgi:bifunctional non-homologous end joining protein LigD
MVNQNTITPHVWTSRVPHLDRPDICVFDLDPADGEDPAVLRGAALALRDLLLEHGHRSWIKTSGSKGFHIVVRMEGSDGFGAAARLADRIGRELVARDPERLTQEFAKADRRGRLYVDTGRNGYSATFAAVYAVRPKRGAPVSAPCTWEEVEAGAVHPQTFNVANMAVRLQQVGDLWNEL